MTVKKVDGKWCVDVRLGAPGRRKERKRHLSPINTKKAALEYEKELVADSLSTSMSSANRNRRYEEFVLEFMTEHVLPRAKYSEIVSKDRILGNHLVPFFGAMKLHEINTASIDRFIAHQDRKGLKKKTVRNHLTVLRKSLSVAVDYEYLDKVPKINWVNGPKPKIDFLQVHEAEQLIAAAEPRWKPMIILALKTGMRSGELLALRWSDVDLVAGYVSVERSVADGGIINTPKSDETRRIPLCRSALAAMKQHRHDLGEFVFCQPDGSMLTRAMMKWPLKRTLRDAGMRHVGWHSLRHTFGTHMIARGAPLTYVQKLMGHQDIQTTARYLHLLDGELEAAVQKLDEDWRGHFDRRGGDFDDRSGQKVDSQSPCAVVKRSPDTPTLRLVK